MRKVFLESNGYSMIGFVFSDGMVAFDCETGDEIVDAESIDEAIDIIKTFENDDKNDGIYVEGFYEVYDRENGEIIAY